MSVRTSMILAVADNGVIGRDNGIPWHLPEDLRRFKTYTSGHVVVMGRRTHESIVARLGRPLPGRISVVVTRQPRSADGPVVYATSVSDALATARAIEAFAGRDEVYVAGGAEIYTQALPEVDRVYLTRVHQTPDGDAVMPDGWLDGLTLAEEGHYGTHSYAIYER
jgi:dihydrofolate reductase